MHRKFVVLGILAMFAVVYLGCSDETVVPTEFEQVNTTGVVRGEIDPNDVAFELIIEGSGANPLVGPFVLRGKNIHYVDSLSALSVDFTIENDGEVSHPEPIGLTFVAFMPTDVTVQNPDNGENGPGAAIVFEFANGGGSAAAASDGEWTPGEESLPRMTLFGVAEGVSIGFVAHIVIPDDTTSGTIGGVVWNDFNEDGIMDNDEPGLAGQVVYLVADDDPQVDPRDTDYSQRTVSGRDGSYRFDDLDAGYYQVIKDVMDRTCRPTTPTVISVILVESNGVVNDFLLANFGCIPQDAPPRVTIEVGDYVKVNGEFVNEGDGRIMARSVEVCKCGDPPPPDSLMVRVALHEDDNDNDDDNDDDCDDWDDDHDWDDCRKLSCWGLKNELRGPVTDIDSENCMVEIMGSWVHIAMCDTAANDTIPEPLHMDGDGDGDHDRDWDKHHWLDLDDVEIGDRVRVRVIRHEDDDTLYAYWLKEWGGTPEKVFGIVDRLSAPSGPVEYIEVLGVMIMITADTDIGPRD